MFTTVLSLAGVLISCAIVTVPFHYKCQGSEIFDLVEAPVVYIAAVMFVIALYMPLHERVIKLEDSQVCEEIKGEFQQNKDDKILIIEGKKYLLMEINEE